MKIKKYQPTLSLRPTQFAVGMLEVEYKVARLKDMKKRKRDDHIAANPVPVVVSPWHELYVTDHHHFLFACWHADICAVRVKVIRDDSRADLTYHAFWRRMLKKRQAYLYDQFGDGPRSPLYLPLDIRGMADDPYRSLAWMVRKEGAYENSTLTFAEFQWADFFRKRRLLDRQGRKGFHIGVERGIALARSHAARNLPGYLHKGKETQDLKTLALRKSKYVPEDQAEGGLATKPAIKK